MLNKQTTFDILASIGFTTGKPSEQHLLEEAWFLLNQGKEFEGGDQQQQQQEEEGPNEENAEKKENEDDRTIHQKSLLCFMCSVMNFDFPWMKREQEQEEQQE